MILSVAPLRLPDNRPNQGEQGLLAPYEGALSKEGGSLTRRVLLIYRDQVWCFPTSFCVSARRRRRRRRDAFPSGRSMLSSSKDPCPQVSVDSQVVRFFAPEGQEKREANFDLSLEQR